MRTWWLLWRLIRYAPWIYALAAFFWILSWALNLAPGLIAQAFFNTLTGKAPAHVGLYGLVVLLLMFQVARVAAILCGTAAERTYGIYAGSLLRKNMLQGILRHPGARALPGAAGEAINRFRDDVSDILQFLGSNGLINLLSTAAFAAGAAVIMLRVNATITLLVFLPLVLVLVAVYVAGRRIDRYRRASRQATGDVTGLLGEMFHAVQAIKVARAEPHVIEHFRVLSDRRRRAALQDQLTTSVLDALFQGAVDLGTGVILLIAAGSMRAGTFTVGDFALFAYNLGSLTEGDRLRRRAARGLPAGRRLIRAHGRAPSGSAGLKLWWCTGRSTCAAHFPLCRRSTTPSTNIWRHWRRPT